MKDFSSLLNEFDTTLQQYNKRNYDRLSPSLSNEQINNYLQEMKINNQEFYELFKWKNGYDYNLTKENCQIIEFDFIILLPDIRRYLNSNKDYWEDYFIPLVTDTTGQFLLFNNKQGKDYGKIHLYSTSLFIENPISYYDSINAMVETSIEAYKRGVFIYEEEEDWLEIDMDQYQLIAADINRKSEYWKKKN